MALDQIQPQPVMLQLRMQPHWMFIDDIRRFVESFCAVTCPGGDREAQVALAAHELVQNAVSNASGPEIELRLEVDVSRSRVSVTVTNPCCAASAATLRTRLARLYAEADPLVAYLRAMREAPSSRGGLGLARIRFEAELDLEVAAEDDRITVRAAGPLAPGPDGAMARARARLHFS